MKVILEYDPATGNIMDKDGLAIHCFPCLNYEEVPEKNTAVADLIKLKNSGFTAEEVIAIKKADLI